MKHLEVLVARLVSSGRYDISSEVVRAGVQILEADDKSLTSTLFPPGSLRHLYTKSDNQAETRTAEASTLKLEAASSDGKSGTVTSPKRARTRLG